MSNQKRFIFHVKKGDPRPQYIGSRCFGTVGPPPRGLSCYFLCGHPWPGPPYYQERVFFSINVIFYKSRLLDGKGMPLPPLIQRSGNEFFSVSRTSGLLWATLSWDHIRTLVASRTSFRSFPSGFVEGKVYWKMLTSSNNVKTGITKVRFYPGNFRVGGTVIQEQGQPVY